MNCLIEPNETYEKVFNIPYFKYPVFSDRFVQSENGKDSQFFQGSAETGGRGFNQKSHRLPGR